MISQNLPIATAILSIISCFSLYPAFADPVSNSLRQRIGDYDIQISTLPTVPISEKETNINIVISSISKVPVTDTPIVIRISDENNELIRTHPILLSAGHYSYHYKFNKSGVFLFSIDILDNSNLILANSVDTNNEVTFDFPIRVSEAFSAEIAKMILPLAISIAAIGSIISLVLLLKFKSKRAI